MRSGGTVTSRRQYGGNTVGGTSALRAWRQRGRAQAKRDARWRGLPCSPCVTAHSDSSDSGKCSSSGCTAGCCCKHKESWPKTAPSASWSVPNRRPAAESTRRPAAGRAGRSGTSRSAGPGPAPPGPSSVPGWCVALKSVSTDFAASTRGRGGQWRGTIATPRGSLPGRWRRRVRNGGLPHL